MMFRLPLFRATLRYQAPWALLVFCVASHLQSDIRFLEIFIIAVGLYLVLPLVLLALTESWQHSILGYFLVSGYPLWLIFTYAQQSPTFGLQFTQNFIPVAILYCICFSVLLYKFRNIRVLLFIERKRNAIKEREYIEILEQLPEGILIINSRGQI